MRKESIWVFQREFVDFANQPTSQAWVAAHVQREFPRLACGMLFLDPTTRRVWAVALPNSATMPNETWNISWAEKVNARKVSDSKLLIGFFSSRSPEKPAGYFDILSTPVSWGPIHWFFATDEGGRVTEHAAYVLNSDNSSQSFLFRERLSTAGNGQTFSDQNIILATCVQEANCELMGWLRRHPEDLLRVHPGTFEQIVAEIFRDQGYEVEVLSSWNQPDGGVDIIAVRGDTLAGPFRVGIQCKRYVRTNTVKADLVWALEGRLEKFHLHKGVLATTAHFEKSVLSEVQNHLWQIELRDFERLTKDLETWGQFERGARGLWLPK